MEKNEIIKRFYEAINKQIDYFVDEYTITYGDVIATLEEIKFGMLQDMQDKE